MKNTSSYWSKIFTKKNIKSQFHPHSSLTRIFLFAIIGSVTATFFWQFFNQYITGSRASTDNITVRVTPSKEQVNVNEEFTVDVLLTAPNNKKVSQLDLRVNLAPQNGGDVAYVTKGYTSTAVGGSGTNYFDTEIFEEYGQNKLRLVLSARKRAEELSSNVVVKIKFKAVRNGQVQFGLDRDRMEIVGPGAAQGDEPVSYEISDTSSISTTVRIGQTATPPSPTITLAPAPTCANTRTMEDGSKVCADVI